MLVDVVEGYAIFTLDPDGRTRTWNSGARQIKGYEREAILGEHVSVFYTAADRAAGVPARNLARARTDGVVEDEGWRVREDGSRFRANVTITAIRDDGELQGYANFELRLREPPLLSTVADHGGSIEDFEIENGDVRLTVHVSPSVDVRRILDAVEEGYRDVELVARRQTVRAESETLCGPESLTEALTERQRTVLDAAYYSGLFEWPRERTAQEVATSLGISSPTFHQYLRKAQKKLLEALY